MKRHVYPLIASCFLFSSSLMAINLETDLFQPQNVVTLTLKRSKKTGEKVFGFSGDRFEKRVICITKEKSMQTTQHFLNDGIEETLQKNTNVVAVHLPTATLCNLRPLFQAYYFENIKALWIGGDEERQILNQGELDALANTMLEFLRLEYVGFEEKVLAINLPPTLQVLDVSLRLGNQLDIILSAVPRLAALRELSLRGFSYTTCGLSAATTLKRVAPYVDCFPQSLQTIEIEQKGLLTVEEVTRFFKAIPAGTTAAKSLPNLTHLQLFAVNQLKGLLYGNINGQAIITFMGFERLGNVEDGIRVTDDFFGRPKVVFVNIGGNFNLGTNTARQLGDRVSITHCPGCPQPDELLVASVAAVSVAQTRPSDSATTLCGVKIFFEDINVREILNCLYGEHYRDTASLIAAVTRDPKKLFSYADLGKNPNCAGKAGHLSEDAQTRRDLLVNRLNGKGDSSEVLTFPPVTEAPADEERCGSLPMSLSSGTSTSPASLKTLEVVKFGGAEIQPGNELTAEVLRGLGENKIQDAEGLVQAFQNFPGILFTAEELAQNPNGAGSAGALSPVTQERADALLLHLRPDFERSGPLTFAPLAPKSPDGKAGGTP